LSSISLATDTPSLVTVGAPKERLEHHIAAFGPQGYFDCIGQDVHTFHHARAGFAAKHYVFCCHFSIP